VALAIFDLDNTLIAGDSDHAWGAYLLEKGIVDSEHYRLQNDKFYLDYQEGNLDIYEYLNFSLAPLAKHEKTQLEAWRADFFESKIRPIILDKGRALIRKHREQGDIPLIITATNRFVTQPIADELGIEHLIAVELEEDHTGYTGKPSGTPSYKDGKITRLNEWLDAQNLSMQKAHFYSDSHNDLPLLKLVDHPIAVDPDDTLRDYSETHDWPILSLRD
jgi:HAD superfamily hydrolase (TIGR01490 family)